MILLVLTILFPILAGIILLISGGRKRQENSSSGSGEGIAKFKTMCFWSGAFLLLEFVLIILCLILVDSTDGPWELFRLNAAISVSFGFDVIGKIFALVMAMVWVLVGFFSFEYMKHEGHPRRYFGIYLIVFGVLMGLCFSANLVTYYAFYEFLTIGSFALVLHNQSREAIMAGLKYQFYSFAGAYLVLFGLYFVYQYALDPSMSFAQGGIIDVARACGQGALKLAGDSACGGILSVSMLMMIIGFGVKAGMFPLQAWLPTAHPVAPAPASAGLSAIIVKAGVLGIIRVIYYIFGTSLFNGSYVQTVVLILSLITVFMGSMLAYREKVLKKRLAYSTVSQVSYILFGLFIAASSFVGDGLQSAAGQGLGLGNGTAFDGAVIHVAAHAFIKSTLFLCAGAIIYLSGSTKVDDFRGIGKKMPVMLGCYTIVSLGLIGIPPFGGFTSKWYICVGAMETKVPVFEWLGPVILLVSALLTAGYLLPISINGFLPGKDFEKKVSEASPEEIGDGGKYHAYVAVKEPNALMLVPIVILTLLSVAVGIWPGIINLFG